ncbi:MAG TPA: hypothetical protein VFE47_25505 [Tepidisphaeraceae bacterium]|jgi:hypothetical protein|nr:hypothetical protein [Tepidisphaeraceae bacterium]
MHNKSTITLHGGLGLLPFGASEEEAERYLGSPTFKETSDIETPYKSGIWCSRTRWLFDYGNNGQIVRFLDSRKDEDEMDLIVTFSNMPDRDYCLTCFESRSKDSILFGEPVIGLHRSVVLERMVSHGVAVVASLDHGSEMYGDCLCLCSHGLAFNCYDFHISSVRWRIREAADKPIEWKTADDLRARAVIAGVI